MSDDESKSKEKKKKPSSPGVRFAEGQDIAKVRVVPRYKESRKPKEAKQSDEAEFVAPAGVDDVAELRSEQPSPAPKDIKAAYSSLGQYFLAIAPEFTIDGQRLAVIYRSMAKFLEGWKRDDDVSTDAQAVALLDGHPFSDFANKAASDHIVVQAQDIKSTPDLSSLKRLPAKADALGKKLQFFLESFNSETITARQWRKLGEVYAEFGLAMWDAGLSRWSGNIGDFFGEKCVEYHLKKAMLAFGTALQIKSDPKEYSNSLLQLAEVQRHTGQNDDARRSYEAYLERYPYHTIALINLVKIDKASKVHLVSAIALLEEYRGLYGLMALRNSGWHKNEESILEAIKVLKEYSGVLNSSKLEVKTVGPDPGIKSYYAHHFPLPPQVAALKKSLDQSLEHLEKGGASQSKGALLGRPPS